MTDDLYDRLRAANPVPGTAPVEPAGSPRTRAVMETAMSTDTSARPTGRRSRVVPIGIAAAGAGVLLAGGLLLPDLLGGEAADGAPLALTMADGDVFASCAPVSVEALQAQQLAFGGTVTSRTDEAVALEVDTWYKGAEDASTVELTTGPDFVGYTVDFQEGDRYLVSAFDGTVSICGLSGEATPELTGLFEQAFR